MRRKPARRYVAAIEFSFHLGELYFWAPILATLRWAPGERVAVVFTSGQLYREFLADPLLVAAFEGIPVEVIRAPLRAPRETSSYRRAALGVLGRLLIRPWIPARLAGVVRGTPLLFAQVAGGYIERLLPRRSVPRIVRFPHTSAAQIMDLEAARRTRFRNRILPEESMLVLDPEAVEYYRLYGAEHFVVLGYHQLSDDWIERVRVVARDRFGLGEHAVLFSFAARDDMLPRAKWEQLHRTAIDAIRAVYGDLPIVIKPHPNQPVEDLQALAADAGWRDVHIRTEHPMLWSVGAEVGVGILTGGIYNTHLLGIPSINYFNAQDEYAAGHGSFMQDLSLVGIPGATDEEELRNLLQRAHDGAVASDFGARRRGIPRIATWSELAAGLER